MDRWQRPQLRDHRFDYSGVAVPETGDGSATRRIEVAFASRIEQVNTLASQRDGGWSGNSAVQK
jgi:hypothetical protein